MATKHSQPKLKHEAKHMSMHGSFAETYAKLILYCWGCQNDGHNKRRFFDSKLKNGKEKTKFFFKTKPPRLAKT